ncbi:protein SCO1 homolog 1, mitochondrial isoform X2 [Magnolia sinica]|nr:protein SCO1 homolog 1, mitochondrial isoform X2 [Magnolia sinica]XP_058110281.1 protein SCO1 homolog 1, mitochondrial isoform X2 [Magnolia sinica]XP_058110282.1 protein SCO1 homolog 1, mitochondrial isoform X2 [Magnolia sinica]
MASGILRNACRRHFYRSLCSYTQHLWRPTKQSPSIDWMTHAVSGIPQSGFRPVCSLVIPLDYVSHASTLSYKYLSTSSMNPEELAAKKPVEVASKEGEKAEESHQTDPAGKPIRRGPVTWLSLLLLILTGAGLIFYYDNEKKRHIEELNTASTAVKQGPSVGKAAIGGPFKLVNHDGRSVTDKDFLGKWTLIYFGFTHCPDICPDELQKLAAAVDKIRAAAGIGIVPVFISVDPERDTVEQVREYVKEFHPNLVGLTGNVDEIRQVARAYRVYYMKTEEEGSDYLVDHSIVMYLMDPNMEFVKFFGKNYDVDALAEGIIKEVKQHRK